MVGVLGGKALFQATTCAWQCSNFVSWYRNSFDHSSHICAINHTVFFIFSFSFAGRWVGFLLNMIDGEN